MNWTIINWAENNIKKRLNKVLTYWVALAMCWCLNSTQMSSFSSRRTSFSASSPPAATSYLKINSICLWKSYFVIYLFIILLLVDIVFNVKKVVCHGLEGEFMEQRRNWIKSTIQDNQLRSVLPWALILKHNDIRTLARKLIKKVYL